jgi:thioredoxin-dependent peroxiredoxin
MKLPVLLLSLCFGLLTTAAWAALKSGDAPPDFTVEAALGGKEFTFSLAEALKKGPVVLYFYPKSFTSVCTAEAHEFAENIENFVAAGASVIGISGDKIEVQRDFSSKECRDKFPVGADPSFSVIKAYDAAFNAPLVGALFANRISYVISLDGKILYAYSDPSAENTSRIRWQLSGTGARSVSPEHPGLAYRFASLFFETAVWPSSAPSLWERSARSREVLRGFCFVARLWCVHCVSGTGQPVSLNLARTLERTSQRGSSTGNAERHF